MEHVCLDLEGVLIPEIWAKVAEYTGEDDFKLTTQDLKDYSELMDMRLDLVKSIGLSFNEIQSLVDQMEPFEGAREFVDWVRDNFQLTIVSDSFYELAWPLVRKLGTPSINCHYLQIENNELKSINLLDKAQEGSKISVLLEKIEDKNGEVIVSALKQKK